MNKKDFKSCGDRTSNLINETKIDIRNEYSHDTVDGNNVMSHHLPNNGTYTTGSVIGTLPLGGSITADYR